LNTNLSTWPPTREHALARLAAANPARYAASRNHLSGAVTGLSPYLTHGHLSLEEAVQHFRQQHRLDWTHKLLMELGWRAYFRHIWQHDGEGILHAIHEGVLPEGCYSPDMPADVLEARTGLGVIDEAVRTLYETGHVHNHARMWLASYLVHQRKVHWRAGADWMVAHLLDGDLASNHLSWQWVAGTASSKPYLFNADNVSKYASAAWHCQGTALDTDYATLERWARDPRAVMRTTPGAFQDSLLPTQPPDLLKEPPWHLVEGLDAKVMDPQAAAQLLSGRRVQLVHAWSLGEGAGHGTSDSFSSSIDMTLAVFDADHHAQWPWSAKRWAWVLTRVMQACTHVVFAPGQTLSHALQSARSVRGAWDPHLGTLGSAASPMRLATPAHPFGQTPRRQRSFSSWWHTVIKELKD
jgi:deoxyribodipyrimidine photo-lyase